MHKRESHELDLSTLIAVVESIARAKHDGHVSIFRFTTEWKCMFRTLDLDNSEDGRREIGLLTGFPSLEEALVDLITQG